VSISGVQGRIAQIQSMLVTANQPAIAPTSGSTSSGAVSAGSVVSGGSATGVRFAAALDAAVHPTGVSSSGWTAPAQGRVTSEFGPRWGTEHEGIDIGAGSGAPVRAAADGVVRRASWHGGYGNAVVIDPGGGVQTLYGHNSSLDVRPGERVSAGQVIAKVGSTGDSTGPHLHFEVEVDGRKVDPRPWLKERGVSL
jgi:murein DD-endopeptidase MepM/ murein hydrolase activator NlpD